MGLSNTGIVAGTSPIRASQNIQYYDLLTGQITDQPVTIKNIMTLGGGEEATSAHKLTLVGITSQTGYMIRALLALGDANPVVAMDKNGKWSWGAGAGSAVDTHLERSAAGYLKATSGFDFVHASTPSAPGAGVSRVYFKADGILYYRSGAAGSETAIGGTNVTDPLAAAVFL